MIDGLFNVHENATTMELTSNFKSIVKTLRSRSKALGKTGDGHIIRAAPRDRRETHFNKSVKELVNSISEMKSFLLTHRKDYIDQHFIMYNVSKMSDIEREEIDRNAQKFITNSKQIISQLRKQIKTTAANPQQAEHQMSVVAIVEDYLRLVGRIWSEQRSLRTKRDKKMRTFGSLTGGRTIKELAGMPIENGSDAHTGTENNVNYTHNMSNVSINEESPLQTEAAPAKERSSSVTDPRTSYSDDDQDTLYEFRSVRITPEDVQVCCADMITSRDPKSVLS